ncbi:MAG: SCO family protein [Candidatus Thiodiazotropha sp. (ex Ctena orbiculata)]|nr:SCO family protein [Candidatus Thiodiazotropha taylori]
MTENATPRLGITALLGISALLAGLLVWSYLQESKSEQSSQPLATEQATLLPELRSLKPFSLSNHNGETFDNQSLLGQWTFMSFGYTYCPDVCPTTMSLFSEMNDLLKSQQQTDPYKITFVSVDPQRDSLERLAEYVTYFNPEFVGATGPEPAIAKLTKPLGILYQRVETEDSAMGYVIDHSASIILVDPQGQYHAYFSPPHDPQKMANDFINITGHARLSK